jgi:D-alanyl-lipoteichoic acid acyltransferase DltB (MBOAT superfamily)
MLFNSHQFIFAFFPIVLIVYLVLVRRNVSASIAWLGAASFVFYASSERHYVWLLPCSVLINYAFARAMRRESLAHAARTLLIVGVGFDLAVLGLFKYTRFLADQLSGLGVTDPATFEIVLPVGVSFYTFTQIAYLVDSYRSRGTERDPLGYFLFVSYYPHLIAGPILHHKEMMPQFRMPRLDRPFVAIFAGLCMFALGLAKKVLIADPLGAVATNVFGAVEIGLSVFDAWVGSLAYTLQIYFDFSGYSDMALGLSYAMGISLPINFNSPYKSCSIIEFWRRWHITLSRFLRDYLYFGLGGNRKGPRRRHLNLLLTMVLGGLWHGASWTFVLWGGLHGTLLLVAHGFRDLSARGSGFRLPRGLGWALTQLAVVVAWVPFRAPTLDATLTFWGDMLGRGSLALPDIPLVASLAAAWGLPVEAAYFGFRDLAVLAPALLIAWLAPNSQEIMRSFQIGLDSPGYHALPPESGGRLVAGLNWQTAVVVGVLLAIGVRSIGGYSEFIYFQF